MIVIAPGAGINRCYAQPLSASGLAQIPIAQGGAGTGRGSTTAKALPLLLEYPNFLVPIALVVPFLPAAGGSAIGRIHHLPSKQAMTEI